MTSREKIFAFANKHGILFVEKGECGFGRPCVGLNRGDGSWLDYNPLSDTTYGPIFPYDSRLCAPEGVDALLSVRTKLASNTPIDRVDIQVLLGIIDRPLNQHRTEE